MPNHFRHYIYGVGSEGDYFLTTTLNYDDAEGWARKHSEQFPGRFESYSIRLTDYEVASVKPL